MSYMENAPSFAGGIQELTLDEIGYVGGGLSLISPAGAYQIFKEALNLIAGGYSIYQIYQDFKSSNPESAAIFESLVASGAFGNKTLLVNVKRSN